MTRAVSSVLGALALTAITLVLATVAGVTVVSVAPPADVPEPIALSASADAGSGWIVLAHESGPTIDVRGIEVRISVGGTRLEHQPPVPFPGAAGFNGAPSGPFNDAADPEWAVGERAGLRLAPSNDPGLSPGASVRIEIYREESRIAAVETTAT